MRIVLLLFLTFISLASYADTEKSVDERFTKLYGGYEIYKEYFYKLRDKVRGNDISELAGMMNYPLSVNATNNSYVIDNKIQFIREYKNIFTSKIRASILNQTYEELFINYQGFMYGDGNVWAAGVCAPESPVGECKDETVKIITINK